MCGITGIFNPTHEIDTKRYYKAHLEIRHRGPDDEGFLVKKKGKLKSFKGDETIDYFSDLAHIKTVATASMILGHRRLSIIDLSKDGHQPFNYKNLSLVYNGEIYNYKELRKELEDIGYSFKTNTDTEVFLISYYHYGNDCFKKFVGMWAAAIYDNENNTLTLCRDYFGIKPLYYYQNGDSLYFSSEIKFLIELLPSLREVDDKTIYDFVIYRYKDHSENTFNVNIKQFLPLEND